VESGHRGTVCPRFLGCGSQEPTKVCEASFEVLGLASKSQSEMVWHSEETTFRDDGPVPLQ